MVPKLSIVIPTKNRYEQLFIVVKAILDNINGSEYEIVINDNNEDNSLAVRFLEECKDNRISYYYTTEKLSQSGNTNDALSKAKGDFVLFIGDDDVVSPYIMDAVELMIKEGIDCLSYSIGYYYWSNIIVTKRSKMMKPGLLLINNPISSIPYVRYSKVELNRVLDMGACQIAQMPRVYHGLVSRALLEKMKCMNGTYAIGSCPDMNLAVSLTNLIDAYSFVNYPLSLSGVSSNSAAGLDARKSHCAKLEAMVENGMLPQSVIENWNPLVPEVWTIPTIYAQALFEVLQKFGIKKQINYTALYANFFKREKWAKDIGWKAFLEVEKLGLSSKSAVKKRMLKSAIRKIVVTVFKPIIGKVIKYPMPMIVENIESIDVCMKNLKKIPFR